MPGRAEKAVSDRGTGVYRQVVRFAKDLWSEIQNHAILDGAAVLAYFFVLAVFPAAIFVLSLLPILSIPHLQKAVLDLLHQVLPAQSANLFEVTVHYVAAKSSNGLLTFGLVFTLWSASSGIYSIMQQLNIACGIKEQRRFWKVRGTAVLLTVFSVGLAIGSLSLVIFGGVVQSWVASILGWSRALRAVFATYRWIVISSAVLLNLAVIYRYGPDARCKFRFLSPGNVTAAAMIALASIGFRFYVSKFGHYSATYGNLAAMIILMLWMYMAGIAVLVGYEIDTMLRKQCGDEHDEIRANPA